MYMTLYVHGTSCKKMWFNRSQTKAKTVAPNTLYCSKIVISILDKYGQSSGGIENITDMKQQEL